MTTGLDYTVTNLNCYDIDCLLFLNKPNTSWYYHNAPYTLTQSIIENATSLNFSSYFDNHLNRNARSLVFDRL